MNLLANHLQNKDFVERWTDFKAMVHAKGKLNKVRIEHYEEELSKVNVYEAIRQLTYSTEMGFITLYGRTDSDFEANRGSRFDTGKAKAKRQGLIS